MEACLTWTLMLACSANAVDRPKQENAVCSCPRTTSSRRRLDDKKLWLIPRDTCYYYCGRCRRHGPMPYCALVCPSTDQYSPPQPECHFISPWCCRKCVHPSKVCDVTLYPFFVSVKKRSSYPRTETGQHYLFFSHRILQHPKHAPPLFT